MASARPKGEKIKGKMADVTNDGSRRCMMQDYLNVRSLDRARLAKYAANAAAVDAYQEWQQAFGEPDHGEEVLARDLRLVQLAAHGCNSIYSTPQTPIFRIRIHATAVVTTMDQYMLIAIDLAEE
eukprot:gene23866-9430_t